VVRHQGIDVFLVILVFFTALTIEPRTLRELPAAWRRLSVALVVGITILPALSWSVAHLVAAGHLRDGVTTIGLAPCEIASIATTAMAGGDVALAGGLLLGSSLQTVAVAGPILAAEASGVALDPWHILVNLLCIVAVPLAVGVMVRGTLRPPPRLIEAASTISTLSVAALVALVASEVHFARSYLSVLLAVVVFVVVSAGLGLLIGRGGTRRARGALLLTLSMRDFAIAAGLATAAFGADAAAPLGLYGIAVLLWGTGVAGFMRGRNPA
jgi:BASS family bile acid:Na+ symporter